MSNPLFCAECGGELEHVNNGYKCMNCDKQYIEGKSNNGKDKISK